MTYRAETPEPDRVDKNKGGRPLHGSEPKRAPLSLRTSPELRDKVEKAAERATRSLAQEVEFRLEMSFRSDSLLGGEHNHRLIKMLNGVIQTVEGRTGKSWREDAPTFYGVKAAVERVMKANVPPRKQEAEEDDHAKTMQTLKAAWLAADVALKAYKAEIGFLEWFIEPAPVTGLLFRGGTLPPPKPRHTAAELGQLADLQQAANDARAAYDAAVDGYFDFIKPRQDAAIAAIAEGEAVADEELRLMGLR